MHADLISTSCLDKLHRSWSADNHATEGGAYADPLPDTGDDAGVGPDRGSTTGIPRWLKALGIIAIGLVLAFVIIMHLIGGLGPGLHTP